MDTMCLNGEFLSVEDARVRATDGGILFGEGVFETIRAESGQLLHLRDHCARLARGLRLLEIPYHVETDHLHDLCEQVLDANGLRDARVRVTVTRGALRGLPITPEEGEPTLIIMAMQLDDRTDAARKRGWRVAMAPYFRNARSPLCSVKCTSYAESLLARRYATRNGFDEALLMNTEGFLAEASMSNVFVVREDAVLTPRVEDGALPGIVRSRVQGLCKEAGLNYRECQLELEDLYAATEVFLTNSLILFMPVVQAGEREIGTGKPGAVVTCLFEAYRRQVMKEIDRSRW